MLIYQCRFCKRTWEFPSPPPLSKCDWCEGGLVYLGTDEQLNQIQVKMTNEKKGGRNYDFLLNLLKGGGIIWGAGSAVNIAGKSIKKENIGKADLFHTLFPWATAGIIHGFQHRQELEKLSSSMESPPELSQETRKVVEMLVARIRNRGPQDLSEPSPKRKMNFQSKTEENLPKRTGPTISRNTKRVEVPVALQWLKILSTHPRVLILGGQGTGKSCLAFWLLEILHHQCRCFAFRLPGEGASYIPPWLGIIHDLNDAPSGSIVLVDEAYLSLFARESLTKRNRELTKIVNLARQKNLGLIFVAHEARHLDKNILSCIATLVIKKPAPLQVALDRSFLKSYLLKAQSVFQGKTDSASRATSYVGFSPSGFEGVLQNPKASFWSDELSHIFASGNLGNVEKPARELTKEEKRERGKKLRDEDGYSYGDIGKDLGVGKTTAYRWLNGENGTGTDR